MVNINRRQFLRGSSAFGFAASLGALSTLGSHQASAADTSGYKAMVCLFLKGGMDHADTVISYDEPSWNQLRSVREGLFTAYDVDNPTSSRNRSNLLKLEADNAASLGGREFALPPALAPLHQMFNQRDLAVVGNVGPLIETVNRQTMESGAASVPARLFSHNDQQSTWMALGVEGSQFGWGGRFVDAALASSPSSSQTFAAISASSNDPFLAGQTARPYRVTAEGTPFPHIIEREYYLGGSRSDDETRARIEAFLKRTSVDSRSLYERDLRTANVRAVENAQTLIDAKNQVTEITTVFPETRLGNQLKAIAQTINIQQFLNVNRQIFYATMGGYDTHSNQAAELSLNHVELAEAMAAFRSALIEINRWNQTVLFTASDFGRTTIDNGDGTDHGWGGHQFVMGGAVRGKRVYGALPGPETGMDTYTETRGRLIPAYSVEQYAATLGRWWGLSSSEMFTALPNLANFNDTDLGFMQTGV
ncbi:MAG: DUF1501 domain-containing protein [Pseudomonadota bacterium]